MSVVKYFLLSDVNLDVRVKINAVKNHHIQEDDGFNLASRGVELYVTCQIFSNGRALGLPTSTSYRKFTVDPMRFAEWIAFPVKYKDLSPTSQLVFTVWETNGNPLGGTCFPMFNKKGLLKLGRRKLLLWPDVEGDGSNMYRSATPYKHEKTELDRLEKAFRNYQRKEQPPVKWLDDLAYKRVEKMQEWHRGHLDSEDQRKYLSVEFPGFKYPIVYHQRTCQPPLPEILPFTHPDRLMTLHDPETKQRNPVEIMYLKLAVSDTNLKPSIDDRNNINEIISSPVKRLTPEQRHLLFKFRLSLTENKRALTKFLSCVEWSDANESRLALELLPTWATIDIADALELLGSEYENKEVRKYAVKQLQRADNEELQSYLLQLVQALRYEDEFPSTLSVFLENRAVQHLPLANFFYRYVEVESYDRVKGKTFAEARDSFMKRLHSIQPDWHSTLKLQDDLIGKLISLSEKANMERGIERKVEKMRKLLEPEGEMKALRHFPSTVMPVAPEVQVNGVVGEKSRMFKSALAPLLVNFSTTPNTSANENYRVLFKCGDDLRQDQLMIQMINLMDSLLKKVKLDLKLTPYRVLATSPSHGFVEFVPNSYGLTTVLAENNKDIRSFLQKYNPKPVNKPWPALDTFVKSCAGYCVITYILGIGDRHLDNVMLTEAGHLFHIDFGWILGKDPKPLPPPMKIIKEMVEAMGGYSSPHYLEFRNYCCLAFNILRKHSGLIINLLGLMRDAGIPHLMDDVEKNLAMVQEKFRLDLSDERANAYLLSLVDESVTALFPQILERMHRLAMMMR